MTRPNHKSIAGFAAAVIVFSLLCLGTASAQPFAWNPPCTGTKLVNTLGCTVQLRLTTNFGTLGPFNVGPGGSIPLALPAGVVISGIKTQAGNFKAATSPGGTIPSPPAAPFTTATGQVLGVTIGPGGCCADVYFDASGAPGCWIWLVPSGGPCVP